MHLQAVIDNIKALISGELLGHGTVHGVVGSLLSNQARSVAYHQARRFQVGGHGRKFELNVLVGGEGRTELLSLFDVVGGGFETCGSSTEGATSNVKSSAVQATQRNLESLSLRTKKVSLGHLDFVEADHARRLHIPSKLVLIGAEGNSFHIFLHDKARHFFLSSFAHDKVVVRGAGSGNERFRAAQNKVVSHVFSE